MSHLSPSRPTAPRPERVGARAYRPTKLRVSAGLGVWVGLVVLGFGDAAGQEPPDSLPPPPPDTAAVSDSTQVEPDSLAVVIDTFPAFPGSRASGFDSAVWEWNRRALLSNRALTLSELVMQIPGVIALRLGDYGTSATVIAFGGAGGRTRVFWDGIEMLALDGSVPDLSRIGLASLERVRVDRDGSELRIELFTLQALDAIPTTLIEIATGDLGTNLLRVDFAHPNTLGGALTFSLDRLETQGPSLEEGGTLSGFGLRYGINKGNRGGVTAELRRYSTETDLEGLVPATSRADWNIRGRWVFGSGLTGDAYWAASSFNEEPVGDAFALNARRDQLGLRLGIERGPAWAALAARGLRDRKSVV